MHTLDVIGKKSLEFLFWASVISIFLIHSALAEEPQGPEDPITPTPTVTATATATPRPPPTITRTPVTPPTPHTEADATCDYHTIEIENDGDWGSSLNVPMQLYQGPGQNAGCQRRIWNQFENVMRACFDPNIGLNVRGVRTPMTGCHTRNGPCYDYRDECIVAAYFRSMRDTVVRFESAMAGRHYTPRWYLYPQSMYEPSDQRDRICLLPDCSWTTPSSGTIYLDKNCRQVRNRPRGRACRNRIRYKVSPVSLIWEKGFNPDSDVITTRFQLVPGHESTWVQWKASSKAPLLVYDPEHTGDITSGAQLFGNWTFGGKREISSLKPIALSDMQRRAEPWPNGYEALSKLDFNRNGKIDGSELQQLALWFDENRDAVSQKDEVRLLKDVGVTEIYFKGYMSEGNERTLRLERGYERLVKGRKILAESVDWYTEIARHPLDVQSVRPQTEAKAAPRLLSAAGKTATDASVETDSTEEGGSRRYALNLDPTVNIGGAWFWQIHDQNGADPSVRDGAFTFADPNDGSLHGHTFGFMRFPRPIDNSNELLDIVALEGTKSRDGGLTIQFKLAVEAGDNYQVKSSAKLSPDGQVLEGVTTASFLENGKNITSTYRWTARRAQYDQNAANSIIELR